MKSDTTECEPTSEMVAFYKNRTHAHIQRVRVCLEIIAGISCHKEALIERGRIHDASKFEPEELIPYIWLTEYYRCKRIGAPFSYPEGVRVQVQKAIEHHRTTNRHHPGFHPEPNQMTEIDLIEMVCDWTAMAQELETGGSARTWADKTIGTDVKFDQIRQDFIYHTISLLDAATIVAGPVLRPKS